VKAEPSDDGLPQEVYELAAASLCQGMHAAVRTAYTAGRSAEKEQLLEAMGRITSVPRDGLLSPRELDVLRGMANGRCNAEIAEHLGISTSTVRTHAHHLFGKLGSADRAAAVSAGYRLGLLRVEPAENHTTTGNEHVGHRPGQHGPDAHRNRPEPRAGDLRSG
jgi:DNA-binding NarL/FixJ family response regulator